MIKMFDNTFLMKGYKKLDTDDKNQSLRIFLDYPEGLINAVIFVEACKYNQEHIDVFTQSVKRNLSKISRDMHYLTVICVNSEGPSYIEEYAVARQVCEQSSFVWIYDIATKSLIIPENQAEDFYGVKEIIENADFSYNDVELKASDVEKGYFLKKAKAEFKKIPPVTTSLVFINVVVFIICTLTGSLLYNIGGVGIKLITGPKDLYRIITSMFLHADISHLFSNMVLLYFLGEVVEKEMKSRSFAICYFLSGLWGCLATFISELITGEYVVVIGASGAVFGLLGALLALVIFKRINRQTMQLGRVGIVIIFSVYAGFRGENIANWAHLGGLLAGFVTAIVYCLLSDRTLKQEKHS